MAAPAEIRIALLGKTGSGKSSAGNVILGEDKFEVISDPISVSNDCQIEEGTLYGRRISVTDTPGIFDTDSTKSEEDVKYSIISCLTECAPGLHVFILVLRVGKNTKEEQQSVKMILESFGEEALKHTVVLFTHGEDLDKNQTIKEFVERHKDLKELVDKCGGRVHVIDCKHWKEKDDPLEQKKKMMLKGGVARELVSDQVLKELKNRLSPQRLSATHQEPGQGSGRPTSSDVNLDGPEYRSNSIQIKQLLTTIETMVRDNGYRYYRNETLQVIAEAKEITLNKIKEETKKTGKKAEKSEIRRRPRQRVKTQTWRSLAGSATGVLLGALLGVPVGMSIAAILTGKLVLAAVARGQALQILDKEILVSGVSGLMATGAVANVGALGTGKITVAGGVVTAVGAVMGGAVGAKATDRADTVGEAAGNAAEAVLEGAWNMVKGVWEFSPTQALPSKQMP